jgi:hypothetical protein
MKYLVRLSIFLLICCGGINLASAQNAKAKTTPDEAKLNQISATADDALSAKLDAYRQQMGFADVIPFTPTGDPEADRPAYAAAKNAWIASNPAEYQSYIDAMTVERPTDPTTTSATPTARPE